MLSPALKRLLVELDKVDARERTAFENDLHSELLHFDKILLTARQFVIPAKHGKAAESAFRTASAKNLKNLSSLTTLVTDLNTLPSTMADADLGSGPYLTTFSIKCAKQDCPNKRKK